MSERFQDLLGISNSFLDFFLIPWQYQGIIHWSDNIVKGGLLIVATRWWKKFLSEIYIKSENYVQNKNVTKGEGQNVDKVVSQKQHYQGYLEVTILKFTLK